MWDVQIEAIMNSESSPVITDPDITRDDVCDSTDFDDTSDHIYDSNDAEDTSNHIRNNTPITTDPGSRVRMKTPTCTDSTRDDVCDSTDWDDTSDHICDSNDAADTSNHIRNSTPITTDPGSQVRKKTPTCTGTPPNTAKSHNHLSPDHTRVADRDSIPQSHMTTPSLLDTGSRSFRGLYSVGIGEHRNYTAQDLNLRQKLSVGVNIMVKDDEMTHYAPATVIDTFPSGIRYKCSGQHIFSLRNNQLHKTLRISTKENTKPDFNHTHWKIIHRNVDVQTVEPDVWMCGHIYRHRHNDAACISFGKGKFRGLGSCRYTYEEKTKTLYDEKKTKVLFRKRKRTHGDNYGTNC